MKRDKYVVEEWDGSKNVVEAFKIASTGQVQLTYISDGLTHTIPFEHWRGLKPRLVSSLPN